MSELHQLDILTEKIYREGMEKAEKEAEELLKKTRAECEQMRAEAQREADKIRQEAETAAEKHRRQVMNELQLSALRATEQLKDQLRHLLAENVLDRPLNKAFENPAFLQEMVLKMVQNWQPEEPVSVWFSKSLKEELSEGFKKQLTGALQHLSIEYRAEVRRGFWLVAREKNVEISFTDEDFREFFEPFCKEAATEILFKKS